MRDNGLSATFAVVDAKLFNPDKFNPRSLRSYGGVINHVTIAEGTERPTDERPVREAKRFARANELAGRWRETYFKEGTNATCQIAVVKIPA